MIKTLILIPATEGFNTRTKIDKLQSLMVEWFGGYTYDGLTSGAWKSPVNDIIVDRCYKYIIALSSWKDLVNYLALVSRVKTDFNQQSVYIEIAGIPEVIS